MVKTSNNSLNQLHLAAVNLPTSDYHDLTMLIPFRTNRLIPLQTLIIQYTSARMAYWVVDIVLIWLTLYETQSVIAIASHNSHKHVALQRGKARFIFIAAISSSRLNYFLYLPILSTSAAYTCKLTISDSQNSVSHSPLLC